MYLQGQQKQVGKILKLLAKNLHYISVLSLLRTYLVIKFLQIKSLKSNLSILLMMTLKIYLMSQVQKAP